MRKVIVILTLSMAIAAQVYAQERDTLLLHGGELIMETEGFETPPETLKD